MLQTMCSAADCLRFFHPLASFDRTMFQSPIILILSPGRTTARSNVKLIDEVFAPTSDENGSTR